MFKNTLDNKPTYTNKDGNELVNLCKSIFKTYINQNSIFSFYKVGRDMEMRPDKVAIAAFGSDEYTEMILKYSHIDNPFAIEFGDIVYIPSLNNVYTDVAEDIAEVGTIQTQDYVKNYHKYIDTSKVPEKEGSDNNTVDTTSAVEANLSGNGNSGITITNGRIYFGNVSSSTDSLDVEGDNTTLSDLVDCARNGVTLGQFLDATIKNEI